MTRRPAVHEQTIELVEQLHRVVDELTEPLARLHADRLACKRGCSGCCIDDLTVFEIEAAVIVRHHAELLDTGAPHPPGGCAFLDGGGGCRIYAHRPYVCRTQGLPFRWATADGEARDICPLNAEGPPIEELPAASCWTLGPVEERLASRQRAEDGGQGRRIPLRDLFSRRR